MKRKHCPKCERRRSVSKFNRNKQKRDGLSSYCAECQRAYTREHFFGAYPDLKEMVDGMSDQDVWRLNRGGHDSHKIYEAYHAATEHDGQPTVVLAKTVKGYGMGDSGEALNISHQQKKMDDETRFQTASVLQTRPYLCHCSGRYCG